ncbi:DUF3732 domain-containing protein [Micromonospora tulbaghiae]|uniref:DUF3732 domain-containing protein n=1 Tax=Micromonospora tulbaghiae TaxID=479978 RepID=UPI0033DCFA14
MTFQVSAISIYNAAGEIRTVPLKTGRMNIITGDSRRGKSALLNIIDYCLASTDFVIKGAALRNFVKVFAVTLVKGERQLFIARPAPAGKAATATTMCIASQAFGSAPLARDDIEFSTPLDVAKDIISDFAGIDRNIRIPAVRSAWPIAPSIRQALFFCLQKQNEVANPDLLFHSQGEEFRPATIRSVIPYFLGALDPEQALRENRLRLKRQELAGIESALAAAEIQSPVSGQALALLTEAVEAGLVPPMPRSGLNDESVLNYLRLATATAQIAQVPESGDDPVSVLVEERRELRVQHARIRAQITNLKLALKENDDFLGQASEQYARLSTLGLLPEAGVVGQAAHCPVCDSPTPQSTHMTDQIRSDLARLGSDITVIRNDAPGINSLIAEQETALQQIRTNLARNQQELDELTASQRAARDSDAYRRAALVEGRISLFLETAARFVQGPPVEDRRDELKAQIAELEDQIGAAARDDRLNSYVSLISAKIRDKARNLDLEHKESPIRLDPKGLTVVADTSRGPVRLSDMGGGENWLGYHVATLLSMHEWFSEQNSPVPRLLVLDQPSQVYFPEDAPDGTVLVGADRVALLNLYKTIQETIDYLEGDLQVIVMEHADLDDEPFRSSVEGRWRRKNGRALVPSDWITEEIEDR